MLHDAVQNSQAATHMDAGLAYVDFATRTITFSGAKVSLYWCVDAQVEELTGDRFAIGGKRQPVFTNRSIPLDERATFYLSTDGLLDQAGGPKGLGFGRSRFVDLLLNNADKTFEQQREAISQALAEYQGKLPQRDDIKLLGFRIVSPEIASTTANSNGHSTVEIDRTAQAV
jgi:serine phosphatase RsbU (regulator of sigma subunit)